MNEFSFVFELFALLLGLAVAEMLRGFGEVLKLRARRKAGVREHAIPASSSGREAQPEAEPVGLPRVRVGWLVPLLGLLVLVDLATFWSMMWMGRATLEMNMLTVFCVLALIGGYYLVATQVFPDEPQLWPDFDAYYRMQKRFVVFGMLVINILAQAGLALVGAMPTVTEAQVLANPAFAVASVLGILVFPAFVWLAVTKRPRVNVALIVFIIATQFFYAWAILGMGLE